MADRGLEQVIERLKAPKRVNLPAGLGCGVAGPVERRLPALLPHHAPAFREPQLGAGVAVVVEEGEVLGGGDEAIGELIGLEKEAVPGRLVVEGKGLGIG